MSNNKPMVSVIVPNYNHSKFLEKRIDSILNQTYQDFELILLDDKSTDNSVDILRRYAQNPKVTAIEINEENSGSTFKQWEKGINMAQGKYIWLAESDDYADTTFLQCLVAAAEADPQVVICQAGANMIDQNDKPYAVKPYDRWDEKNLGQTIYYDGKKFDHKYMRITNVLYNASGIIFRRDAVNPFPDFVKQYRCCGDWLFWYHLAQKGKVAIVHKKLNYFRRHGDNVSMKTPIEENFNVIDHFVKIGAISPKCLTHTIIYGIQQRHVKHIKNWQPEHYDYLMQKFYDISGYHSMFPYHFSQFVKFISYIIPVFRFPSHYKI